MSFSVSDVGILGKRKSELSQQESNIRLVRVRQHRATGDLQDRRSLNYMQVSSHKPGLDRIKMKQKFTLMMFPVERLL